MAYSAIVLLTLALTSTKERLQQLIVCIVMTGTAQSLYGAFTAFSGTNTSWLLELPQGHRATGTFVNQNFFADFLVLCLSLGIGLMIAKLNKDGSSNMRASARALLSTLLEGKAAMRICLALMVIGVVLSRSRTGNVPFFASLSITGILAFILIKERCRSLSILLASLIAIDVFYCGQFFWLRKGTGTP